MYDRHTAPVRSRRATLASPPTPDPMIPELFHVGPFSVSPFGLMLVAAFLGGYAQLRWGMKRIGVGSDDDSNAILVAAAIGGLLGGKLYYAALYSDWHLIYNRAGIVFYGSLIGGALAVTWVIRRRRLPFARCADAAAPSIAIGYAIGRVGCLLVGDDYGLPTNLPWGMTFPEGPIPTRVGALESNFGLEFDPSLDPSALVAVHPTQLYETLIALAIWLFGRRLIQRGAGVGTTALSVFALLAGERFAIEFLRAKDDRWFGALTLAQVISLGLLLLLLAIAVARRVSARRRPGSRGAAAA